MPHRSAIVEARSFADAAGHETLGAHRLRVAMVFQDNGAVGGVESSIARLGPHLSGVGIDPLAVIFGGEQTDGGAQAFLAQHLPTIGCTSGSEFSELLDGIDVVHFHAATCLRWDPALVVACMKRGIPAALTVHLPSFPPPPKGPRGLIRQRAAFAVRGRVIQRSHLTVLAPSRAAALEAQRRFRPWPIVVSPLWNGTPDLGRSPLPDGSALRVGFVGRLSSHKRPAVFLEALALARSQGAAVVGEVAGSGELEGELVEVAHRLGIGDAVNFRGQVSDVAPLLRAVHLLLFTSMSEGLPMASMEAASVGRATVVGRALRDTMSDLSQAVIVVDGDEPAHFAAEMVRLAGDAAAVDDLGRRAREQYEGRFSADSAAQRLRWVYDRMRNRAAKAMQ